MPVIHHHEDPSSTDHEEQLLCDNHHQKDLLLDAFDGHPQKQEKDRYTMTLAFTMLVKIRHLHDDWCYTVYESLAVYSHGLMHRESFPVNSVFCAQPQKFSQSKVLPYTVFK